MRIPTFPGRRKRKRHVALMERVSPKAGDWSQKECEEMSIERFSRAGELNGSVVVEVDGQGRIWFGLPLRDFDEQARRQECAPVVEHRGIEPGHLGRDGEWW